MSKRTVRRRLATSVTAWAVVAGIATPASGLSLLEPVVAPLGSLAGSIEDEALDAVADAPSFADAFATYITAPLDSSDEAARYDDPYFLNWPTFLPAYPLADYTPSTENDCTPGNIQCVDNVVREMQRRYDKLGCDHNAAFALTYLLTTMEYRDYWHTGAFDDPAWLNHYDAVFGQFYFDAVDDWYKRGGDATPPAWRIAFEAADRRSLSGMGDVFLGMNAHIRRDLPFVLEAIGQTAPDGSSRKADHDRVNEFLNAVSYYAIEEVAARHDPTMDDGDVPYVTVDDTSSMHVIMEWREEAWRKAELLRNAGSQVERDRIARWIENDAAASAIALRALYQQDDSTARDSHCNAWLESR
jgi:hypothetical protein